MKGNFTTRYTCELVSADLDRAVKLILRSGIKLKNVHYLDLMTLQFECNRKDYRKAEAVLERRGERLKILRCAGAAQRILSLRKRPVLLLGIALMLCFMIVLPGRICFVRVEGNVTVPDRQIIEAAEDYGVYFWASRRELRSEKVKNGLLSAVGELNWVGVNTKGCVAVISVRERSADTPNISKNAVSSIVASRDGVVCSMTVTNGSPLCKVGQAVKAGETLISGYSDLGLVLRASNAEGEVYADTVRELEAVIPVDCVLRGEIESVQENFSLIIGKKRIFLSKDSGILDSRCVKMTVTDYLTLPGGFQLPVGIQKEVYTFYTDTSAKPLWEDATQVLTDYGCVYLSQQMVAGQIIDKKLSWEEEDGLLVMTGHYRCREMIGKVQAEEIIK
jgi:sporulation protein YqfD